jgi:hypothetical protein
VLNFWVKWCIIALVQNKEVIMTTLKELKKVKVKVNDLYLRVDTEGAYHFAYMLRDGYSDMLLNLDTQKPVMYTERDTYLKLIERNEGLDRVVSTFRFNDEIYRYVLNTSADKLEDLARSFYEECDPGKLVKASTLLKLEKQLQLSDKLDAMKLQRMNEKEEHPFVSSFKAFFNHRHQATCDAHEVKQEEDCM